MRLPRTRGIRRILELAEGRSGRVSVAPLLMGAGAAPEPACESEIVGVKLGRLGRVSVSRGMAVPVSGITVVRSEVLSEMVSEPVEVPGFEVRKLIEI